MANVPAIRVDDLSFRYVGRKQPAIQNVSFSVDVGETLLVLGPSGGGKSTLALCLNGLIPHSVAGDMTGRVEIDGQSTRDFSVARLSQSAGLIFQDPDTQFCMLRVDDEIAFGLENLRVLAGEMPSRIGQALGQVGLEGKGRERIDRLSGGTRQRVALAAVLALRPPVLVFDEPTSNLDPSGAVEVFRAIDEIKRQGDRTIVIVEHRLDDLIDRIDRILVLDNQGRVAALAGTREILRDQRLLLESYGVWVPQVAEIAGGLADHGIVSEPFPLTVDDAAKVYGGILSAWGQVANNRPTNGTFPNCHPEPQRRISASSEPAGAGDEDPSPRLRMTDGDDAPGAAPAIAISHLSYVYPGGTVGLRNISLVVPTGGFVAVVGPNGAGKSTLAKHLIGSIRPPTGKVRIDGRDVRHTSAAELARVVGYVFQNPEHQFLAPTVFDELAFGLRRQRVSEGEVREQVDTMLASFGLTALARANPFSLSHGEKRRLSVATMLVLGQDVLVLDEPTFGQDRRNTNALMGRLVELNRAGRTILMITHDPRLIAEYARTVVVLVDGEVAFTGSPGEFFADPSVRTVARIAPPAVFDLSRRLALVDPTFPRVLTVDDFVVAMVASRPNADAMPDRGAATDRTAFDHSWVGPVEVRG